MDAVEEIQRVEKTGRKAAALSNVATLHWIESECNFVEAILSKVKHI